MSYPILPKRVFNSPLIEFANFEDGSHVHLIRLFKPYADGRSFAVHETTKSAFCSNGMFKTYEEAKEKFELMVKNGSHESKLRERSRIYKKERGEIMEIMEEKMLAIKKVSSEYLHLLRMKKGIEKSARRKKVELAKECRLVLRFIRESQHQRKLDKEVIKIVTGL